MSDSRPCRSEFRSRPITKEYAEGYDKIFKPNKKPIKYVQPKWEGHWVLIDEWDNEGGQ